MWQTEIQMIVSHVPVACHFSSQKLCSKSKKHHLYYIWLLAVMFAVLTVNCCCIFWWGCWIKILVFPMVKCQNRVFPHRVLADGMYDTQSGCLCSVHLDRGMVSCLHAFRYATFLLFCFVLFFFLSASLFTKNGLPHLLTSGLFGFIMHSELKSDFCRGCL